MTQLTWLCKCLPRFAQWMGHHCQNHCKFQEPVILLFLANNRLVTFDCQPQSSETLGWKTLSKSNSDLINYGSGNCLIYRKETGVEVHRRAVILIGVAMLGLIFLMVNSLFSVCDTAICQDKAMSLQNSGLFTQPTNNEKTALAQHCLNQGHTILFQSTTILSKQSGF